MKKSILFAFAAFLMIAVSAQQKVALQSNGTTSIFGGATPFVDAYNAAQDGDTIYLPGAVLSMPAGFNKKLAIYGAGHYPDSTAATGKTILSGNMVLNEDADSLFLEGVEITGSINFVYNHSVNRIMVSRCKIYSIDINGDQSTPSTYNTFRECVIVTGINIANTSSCVFTNNIFQGQVSNGNDNAFFNNLFLYSGAWYNYVLNNVDNCSITNNVFINATNSIHSSCDLNTFSYNIFRSTPTVGNNTFSNNYLNIPLEGLLVSQSGTAFDYSHDYHLVDPDSYPGSDATQAGIYGGFFPYKDGAVPSNPHYIYQNIPNMTDENGLLEVNITVSAQEN